MCTSVSACECAAAERPLLVRTYLSSLGTNMGVVWFWLLLVGSFSHMTCVSFHVRAVKVLNFPGFTRTRMEKRKDEERTEEGPTFITAAGAILTFGTFDLF